MIRFIFILFFLTINVLSFSQNKNLPLSNCYSLDFKKILYIDSTNIHTSFKPILVSENFKMDSISKIGYVNNYNSWILKKTFNEHLFVIKGKDYSVVASPLINLSAGRELIDSKKTLVNSRGYLVKGTLGSNISFSTSFFENQAVFPNYLNSYILNNKIVPGQGFARNFKEDGFDYAMSSGHVTYTPNSMFSMQFGHGKSFIGDGYRSLLLSDNTFNYPYLKVQTNFWKIQYTNFYAELMDINYFETNSLDNWDQMGYPKKYLSSHYLSMNLSSKLNISLFESVIWRANHTPGSNGFDINYLNPIALLRPVEFSINSPDNILVGLNAKYTLITSYLYGQLILDEFSVEYLRTKNSWANKFGYQIGYKIFNFLNVDKLSLQAEYNYVRPYTYAHKNPTQNYAHYNQPLAHPLGANFSELLLMATYSINRFVFDIKMMSAKYGGQIDGDPISYGSDLFLSTGNFAQEANLINIGTGRPSDIGIEMYQGNLSKIKSGSLNIGYVINPLTNLKINLGFTFRNFENENENLETRFLNFGIISDLFNKYYDI